jgi:hypothetical protein
MDGQAPSNAMLAPLGLVEPHAAMLRVPPDGQPLYKIMSVENLLRSISGRYLYFNRVDSYGDFPQADRRDGQQLQKDLPSNTAAKFAKAPEFSAATYYDQSRARTYVCCLSLENSDHIWTIYGGGGTRGKVGVGFDFSKLRAALNEPFRSGTGVVEYNGQRCRQIFSINYGIVQYVDWAEYQANLDRLPNPMEYTYLKDKRFADERELRISLSTLGIGDFVLNDGSKIEFPPGVRVEFDFGRAIGSGTVQEILRGTGCDNEFLVAELNKLGVGIAPGSDVLRPAAAGPK